MASVAPSKAAAELKMALNTPEPSAAAQTAERRIAEHAAAMREAIMPDKLLVRLDDQAGRFVQTLTDSMTQEMLRRYPSEAQLAYSRAVTAYLRALHSK